MRRESLIRLVKKEHLLFKKKRTESHRVFHDAIESVLDSDDFYFVDSETLQSFHLKAMHEGVGSSIHYNLVMGQTCNLA